MANAGFCGRAKCRPVKDRLLLPFQADWVEDESRLKIMEKARQIGISWASAYGITRGQSLETTRLDAWISSRDEIQARLFLEDCKSFGKILNLGARDLGELVVDENGSTAHVLAFMNGTRAHSMSSNPDAQAGKRGRRLFDEGALHKDLRKLYAIGYPGITWGGCLEIVSTHRGTANFFNQLVIEIREKGNPKGFSLHRVTLQDALDQGFLYKLQTKLPEGDERQGMDEAEYFDFIKAGCADNETFLQEYMCVPSDDASAFISYELIDGNKFGAAEKWERSIDELRASKNPIFIGVDIGRVKDLTVIWVNEKEGGRHLTRKLITMAATAFDEQERRLYELLALPAVRRACIDNTGIGRQFTERAQKAFGEYRVEAVTFSGPVKEELAYPLRAALEDHTLTVPDDRAVVSDFRGIRKETTAAGNIRFAGERGENGHCDRFWAAALALHAGKTNPAFAFEAVPMGGRPTTQSFDRRRVLL